MSVHPTARGFELAAEVYERARPDYPDNALDFIVESLGLSSGDRVVDLGAGTGKFARQLVAHGLRVTAVEPVREMRAILEAVVPQATAVEGTAEAIPLEDETADGVTAAQAFHWFERRRALPEIYRVLRRGGASRSSGTFATSPTTCIARTPRRSGRTVAASTPSSRTPRAPSATRRSSTAWRNAPSAMCSR